MPSFFDWKDYKLDGLPALSLDDYTFQAIGMDDLFQDVLAKLKMAIQQRLSVNWKIIGYWGVGKSTFIYNLCSRINDRFFFEDEMEARANRFGHVLSIYVECPKKANDLLEYTYENGLPYPWSPTTPKETAKERRSLLFRQALRKLAYILLSNGFREQSYLHKLWKINWNGCMLLSSLLSKTFHANDVIRKTDEMTNTKERYRWLSESLRFYLNERLGSDFIDPRAHLEDAKSQKVKEFRHLADNLPYLIYPENSRNYREGFAALFRSHGVSLRSFDIFSKLCLLARTCIFLMIDEVEDWQVVVTRKLDRELLSILAREFPWVTLVFRTEVVDRLRSRPQIFQRYMAITQLLEDIVLPEPRKSSIVELTKTILSTARSEVAKAELFPFTEEFVNSIADKTKRGRRFNPRTYVRVLTTVLERSRNWQREETTLGKDMIDTDCVLRAVSDAILHETEREIETSHMDAGKAGKFAVAAVIAQRLLSGAILYTRESVEKEKAEYASRLKVPAPSDFEILACADPVEREKLKEILDKIEE